MHSALAIYQDNSILSASPVELVGILYRGAAAAVRQAREHLAAGDIASRSASITKAQNIILELAASLDASQAPALVGRLRALYHYMMERLTEANLQQTDAPLAEVGTLIGTLQDAWQQCPEVEPALTIFAPATMRFLVDPQATDSKASVGAPHDAG